MNTNSRIHLTQNESNLQENVDERAPSESEAIPIDQLNKISEQSEVIPEQQDDVQPVNTNQ